MFLLRLLEGAGAKADRCGVLLRRRREWEGRQAWFFVNPTGEEVTARVDLEGYATATDLLGGVMAQANGEMTVRVGGMDVVCVLLS